MNPDPTDSPSSPSPKPDENPIQREPKPEMLEKAAKIIGDLDTEDRLHVRWRVALALEEAVRARDEEWRAKALETIGKLVASEEALRASEASVESLRKEKEAERADENEFHAYVRSVEDKLRAAEQNLEAARAEATKAVMEKVIQVAKKAHAAWDGDNDVRVGKILIALAYGHPGYRADIDELWAAIRAPRPPELEMQDPIGSPSALAFCAFCAGGNRSLPAQRHGITAYVHYTTEGEEIMCRASPIKIAEDGPDLKCGRCQLHKIGLPPLGYPHAADCPFERLARSGDGKQ